MIDDIPRAVDVLGSELPLAGSETQAFAMTAVLQSVSDDMTHMRHLVTLALADLGMLQGVGLGALVKFLTDRLMSGGARVSDDVETASHAFARFARTSDTLDDAARATLRDCGERLEEIREASRRLGVAGYRLGPNAVAAIPHHWRTPPPVTPPLEDLCQYETADLVQSRALWHDGATLWHGALESIATLRATWRDLVTERQEAEQKLAVTLDASMLLTTIAPRAKGGGARAQLSRAITGLDAARPGAREHPQLGALLAGELSPHEAAEVWRGSHYSAMSHDRLTKLPLDVLIGLAGAVGIPAESQNVIARAALVGALKNPQAAYRIMGFAGSTTSLAHFTAELRGIDDTLHSTVSEGIRLPVDAPIQLLGFGNHDDAVTATVVIGDLDTATHVAVNVSGMFSSAKMMGETLPGATQLFSVSAHQAPEHSYAVAHWIGYRSPGILPGDDGVLNLQRAQAGGYQLSRFLDGALAARERAGAPLPERVVLMGHSYGSTTVVEASKILHYPADHIVTYGSAGVDLEHLDHLPTTSVSATNALGDQVAWLGILGSGRTDPRAIDGVSTFSSAGGDDFRRVTMHDMYAEEGEWSLLNPRKVGYLSSGTRSLWRMGEILAGKAAEKASVR